MQIIESAHQRLLALSRSQLALCLNDLPALERELSLPIARDVIDENVVRALTMKLKKMESADVSRHEWFTYWLIVIREENIGAGFVGFKGYPNKEGSTEIGYGIAAAYQNKGYMSEAVRALIDWAFLHPFCKTITATEVQNPASRRLLEKLGAELVEQEGNSTSWKISRS
jgi:RimJ/RimL family protein N-acetyltransferase